MMINNTNFEDVLNSPLSLSIREKIYIDLIHMKKDDVTKVVELLTIMGVDFEVTSISQITEDSFVLDFVDSKFALVTELLKTMFTETSTIRTDFMYFQKVKDCALEEVLGATEYDTFGGKP